MCSAEEEIRRFLAGETPIIEFRERYDANPEINDFLQGILDRYLNAGTPFLLVPIENRTSDSMKYFYHPEEYPGYPYGDHSYCSAWDYLNLELNLLTTNVRTASGASEFYQRVYNIFYQYDPTVENHIEPYSKAFCFALEAIPAYLSGGVAEMYIQEHIIPLFPESMSKGKRIKAIRAKIREEFRSEKGCPCWIQSSEWPLGKDGKPTVYLGKKKKYGGEMAVYSFRDESDGSIIQVEQFY